MTEGSIQVTIKSEGNIGTCASRQLGIFMHMHVLFCSQSARFSVFPCGVLCGFACFKQKFEETNSQTKRLYYTAVLLFVCVGGEFLCLCIMTLLPKYYPNHHINTKVHIKRPAWVLLQQSRAEIDDAGQCVFTPPFTQVIKSCWRSRLGCTVSLGSFPALHETGSTNTKAHMCSHLKI